MRAAVPADILQRLRDVCAALPQTHEEAAWAGVRWRVRKHTFAHVLMVDQGWPPAYAQAAQTAGPACVLTFRSAIAELDPRHFTEAPYFRPRWWPDIVGAHVTADANWAEISGLLTASYRKLAPKALIAGLGPDMRRSGRDLA